jgi:hypothetical protein
MDDVARIEAVGGPFDGGLVKDLGGPFQWVDGAGQSYDLPGPGRVLHHRHHARMRMTDQFDAERALIVLSDDEIVRQAHELYKDLGGGDVSLQAFRCSLEVLASVARDDD